MTSFNASWLYVEFIGWLGDLICIVGPIVGPTIGWTFWRCNCWSDRLDEFDMFDSSDRSAGRSADRSHDTTVGPTGRADRSADRSGRQLDRVNAALIFADVNNRETTTEMMQANSHARKKTSAHNHSHLPNSIINYYYYSIIIFYFATNFRNSLV